MYNRQLRELDKTKQHADLLEFNKYVLDEQAHPIYLLWTRGRRRRTGCTKIRTRTSIAPAAGILVAKS